MVLESIVDPLKAEKTPRDMFYVGLIYSSIGLLLAYFTFGSQSSFASIFLTTIPLVVIMHKTLQLEENKDEQLIHSLQGRHRKTHKETFLIKEHGKALSLFVALFLGMVVAYTLWYIILPVDMEENLFSFQINEINRIRATSTSGDITGFNQESRNNLFIILENNFRVWVFCIIFSFLYGSGAILILTLNASIVGVAIGIAIRNALVRYAPMGHIDFLYNYFGSFSISFCYLIHGIPEISAYFLGALGGGIISVAVARHGVKIRKEFIDVTIDSIDLVVLSAVILLLAGVIEVYLTPLICGV
ncbi:MAG: stage II sporulation protein M [Candidatus Altiarchaeota archaeon]|nr:stage II sporulation protein M [Candidatus Altiarchaeota archaeon]